MNKLDELLEGIVVEAKQGLVNLTESEKLASAESPSEIATKMRKLAVNLKDRTFGLTPESCEQFVEELTNAE